MPYDVARRDLGAGARPAPDGADRAVARPDRVARGRRVPARREPAARRRRGGARRASPRVRRAARGRVRRSSGSTSSPPPLDRLYRGAILHPRDGAIVPARWVRRLAAARGRAAGAEIARARRASTVDELDADAIVVAADGFTAVAAARARRLVRADPRAGARDRAARPSCATTAPHYARDGLRLLAAAAGRPARDRRQARRRASRPRRRTSRRRPSSSRRGSRSCVERLVGSPAGRHVTAGPGSGARRPTSCRSSGGCRAASDVWVAGGYSGHGNVARARVRRPRRPGDPRRDGRRSSRSFDPARPSLQLTQSLDLERPR